MRSRGAALLSLLAAACGPASPAAIQGAREAGPPAAATAPTQRADDLRYRVAAGPGAAELSVEVDVPHGLPAPHAWAVDPSLRPYVRDVKLASGGSSLAAPPAPDGWRVPACAPASGCVLRYRFLLGEAGAALQDFDRAMARDGAVLSPPSAWMLRPVDQHGSFVLSVTAAPGEGFVSGLSLTGPGATTFRGDVGALEDTPYAVFGKLSQERKQVSGGLVDVAFLQGRPAPAIDAWIDHALAAVATYYQRFPIEHAALMVGLRPGSGIGGGHTMGNGGGSVLISVGASTDAAALAEDWVLVHELIHVSFPDVSTPWIEEGLATYLEPLIRVRVGLCSVDDVWRSLVEGLPQGQPEAGDGGLDVTDTWGRRYWGGAQYWLLGDLEIRQRTGGARSIDDALRAVNRAGGNVAQRWDLDRVLALADGGAGVAVLGPLRKKMGATAVQVDLGALWKSLGVAEVDGKMVYDDTAPLASIRRAMTAKGAAAAPSAPPANTGGGPTARSAPTTP